MKIHDMVVTPKGRVGLLVDLMRTPERGAKVQFVNSGKISSFNWRSLRVATEEEIEAAGLHGVGCNQSSDVKSV